MPRFYLPTKPYSLTDYINRIACATGSVYAAMSGHDADYNGHSIHLNWNEYRQYYVGEYTWAGRNVVTRGTDFRTVLEECIQEFDRQGRGAGLGVHPGRMYRQPNSTDPHFVVTVDPDRIEALSAEDLAICQNHPRLIEGKEAYPYPWMDWKYAKAPEALRNDKMFGVSSVGALINASTVEEYQSNVDAAFGRFRENMERNREQAMVAQRAREEAAFPGLEDGLDCTVSLNGIRTTPARLEQIRRQFEGQ